MARTRRNTYEIECRPGHRSASPKPVNVHGYRLRATELQRLSEHAEAEEEAEL